MLQSWNTALATSAQTYANTCNFARQASSSLTNIGGYTQVGQANAASTPGDFASEGDFIFEWIVEGFQYDKASNTCSDLNVPSSNCLGYKTVRTSSFSFKTFAVVKEKGDFRRTQDSNPRSSDYAPDVLPLHHTLVNPFLTKGTFVRKVAVPHSPD